MTRLRATPSGSVAIRNTADAALRIAVVVGTRPEVIKLAPVVRALAERSALAPYVISTGQQRELVTQALADANITADLTLDLMTANQTPASFAARVLDQISPLFARERFDAVLVQGDTTTVVATGMAAAWAHLPVGHVEAGLRSYDLDHPFPEEIHRRMLGTLATWHFAPTVRARRNLLDEGVSPERVFTTGNTIVDALHFMDLSGEFDAPSLRDLPCTRLIAVTAHRRESHGAPLAEIARAIATIATRFPDATIVLPVHPNPNVRALFEQQLSGYANVRVIEPVGYRDMLRLLKRSTVILTDSGGIQEEAPSLNTPVLIMRDVTERPEVVSAGAGRLVGTQHDVIVRETARLLTDEFAHRSMARAINPFGDGLASGRIADILELRLRGRIASGGRVADIA